MGWFSPVKGSYPSLAQVDKTLPVAEGSDTIERGYIVALAEDSTGKSKDGVFKVANETDTILFVSLQDYNDPAAAYAGTAFDPKGGVPAITGIDLAQDGEYETSIFDKTKTYSLGDKLTAKGGVLTPAAEGNTVIGYVTRPFNPSDAAASERWVNNAVAVPAGGTDQRLAKRTGANVSVIRFKTKV